MRALTSSLRRSQTVLPWIRIESHLWRLQKWWITISKPSVLRAKRLTTEELFYYQQWMQYLHTFPLQEGVLANRSQFNITDTLIKVPKGGFLKLWKSLWFLLWLFFLLESFRAIQRLSLRREFVQRLNPSWVELRIKAEFIDTKIKGRMGRSIPKVVKHHGRSWKYRHPNQDEIIMGSISLKRPGEKSRKQGRYHLSWSLSIVSASMSISFVKDDKLFSTILMIWVLKSVRKPQDGPYLFQALLGRWKPPKENSHLDTYGRQLGFSELMPFYQYFWTVLFGISAEWITDCCWDTIIAKAIDSSKNIVPYNTVGNKEDIAGKITKNPHIIITVTGQGNLSSLQIIFF